MSIKEALDKLRTGEENPSEPIQVQDTFIVEEPKSDRGKIYALGRHRLLCGDNSIPYSVRHLFKDTQIDLCFTSPPYLNARTYGVNVTRNTWSSMMNYAFAGYPFKDDAQILVNLGMIHIDCEVQPYWNDWIPVMNQQGWRWFGMYIWDKLSGLPKGDDGRLWTSHELIFHLNKKARNLNKTHLCLSPGMLKVRSNSVRERLGKYRQKKGFLKPHAETRVEDSIIRVSREVIGFEHPAVFNYKLASKIIEIFTQPNEIVLDQFCGSGSTIVACEQTGRIGYGIEIQPEYCDIIRKRWAWEAHGKGCDWEKLTPVWDKI